MGRKRKVPIVEEEKENEDACLSRSPLQLGQISSSTANNTLHHGPMYTIMSNVQLNETFHKKYIKEMQQLYVKMDHDAFMFTFIKMIKSAMEADESNDYANTTLLFCAKFVSSYNGEDTHIILVDICKWLLTTISNNPHIRFRLCQFVNMILNALGAEAALDDVICDNIMDYMLARLRDISPSVRVQAILALQRLQVPDNPDDTVLRSYQFHLCSDPSPRVRQAVITSMGRNYNTIPYILDRLWDIDEKVRRHTYLHMSSYPVKSYKVSQRLMLMEQGLNDRSEMVHKVVVTIMLQQWIESYQKNLILLVSGLKLDSNEAEIDRFRKIAKLTLKEIFKRQPKDELISCIPLEEEGELHKCVPFDKLSIEIALYWQCLTEFLQEDDDLDIIVPELSSFCAYVQRYCQSKKDEMDKFEHMEFQYILLSLMEILYTYDLGDEIGRENLLKLLTTVIKSYDLDEKIINVIVKCTENLIENQNARLQYFVDLIQEVCELNAKQYDLVHDRNLINELMSKSSDAALNLKLSSLKVKILDLEEQEMNFVQKKDYVNAHRITEMKNSCSDEYSNLLRPLIDQQSSQNPSLPLPQNTKVTNESILKCLQVAFYMVVSKNIHSLTPNVCKLYNDFICRYIASTQIATRDWALKCGIAYSMLYESLAKDVFVELYSQFYKNHNIRIWKTAIAGIFELLDRYGMDNLVVQEQTNKSKKSGRLLYNTLEILDNEEETVSSGNNHGYDVIFLMSHFLDTCDDVCIVSAIINGFCRLILRGHIKSGEIIEKLLLRYFNPATDNEINQILGVFLENLIQRKKQDLLYPCLLPTVCTVLSAPYDSPLQEIKPETIMLFMIDATRQEFCPSDINIHNKLAKMFLQEMQSNVDNKELCKLLAKEIITLELNVADNLTVKNDLKEMTEKLIKCEFDPKTIKNIIDFKDILDGIFKPILKSTNPNGSDEDDKSDEEVVTTTEKERDSDIAQTVTPQNATQNATPQNATQTAALPEKAIDLTNCVSSEIVLVDVSRKEDQNVKARTPSPSKITKVLSPSASAPTTYGRENRVGLRYLRKSLNTSRNNSISDSGDGPSRPAKIRIEARIDSDKKPSEPKDQKKDIPEISRARRNLRRNLAGGFQAENQKKDQDVRTKPTDAEPPPASHRRSHKQKSPDKLKETYRSKPHEEEKRESAITKRSEKEIIVDKERGIISPRRTRRKAGAETVQTIIETVSVVDLDKEKAQETVDSPPKNMETINLDALNTSEVIPASPTPEEVAPIITRMRRVASTRNTALRAVRKNTNVNQGLNSISPKISANNNANIKKTPSSKIAFASTPIRNGRKRVLHPSPKNSLHNHSNVHSPLRKQYKVDNGVQGAASPSRRLPRQTVTSAFSVPKPIKSASGSPSSTKENEMAITHKQSIFTIASSLSSIPDENNDGDIEISSQSDEAPIYRSPKSLAVSSPKNISYKTGPSILTRNSARKERQSKMIMTRKRLSLENQLASSTSSVKIISPSRPSFPNRTTKRRQASKIPVFTLIKKGSTNTIGESTSTSSVAEESASSTMVSSTRKALAQKMTRIVLATSRAGGRAMPMRVVGSKRGTASARAQGPEVAGEETTRSRYTQRRRF